MNNAPKLAESLEAITVRIDTLTPAQMHNAMINCDRLVSSFGKSWQQFRTFRVTGDTHIYDDCTKEQMIDYVAHKKEMLAQHSYML